MVLTVADVLRAPKGAHGGAIEEISVAGTTIRYCNLTGSYKAEILACYGFPNPHRRPQLCVYCGRPVKCAILHLKTYGTKVPNACTMDYVDRPTRPRLVAAAHSYCSQATATNTTQHLTNATAALSQQIQELKQQHKDHHEETSKEMQNLSQTVSDHLVSFQVANTDNSDAECEPEGEPESDAVEIESSSDSDFEEEKEEKPKLAKRAKVEGADLLSELHWVCKPAAEGVSCTFINTNGQHLACSMCGQPRAADVKLFKPCSSGADWAGWRGRRTS